MRSAKAIALAQEERDVFGERAFTSGEAISRRAPRVFIARAAERLDLRVLDERFAALDAETLKRVLGCVLGRAETLMVIARP
jgi:hypothetical protein